MSVSRAAFAHIAAYPRQLGLRGLSASAGGPKRPADGDAQTPKFSVVEERKLFQRFQTVTERRVCFPDGKVVSFDILGHGIGSSVLMFPLCAAGRTTTLLREYGPGPGRVQYGFPAGMVERKHGGLEDAARAELEEEAGLAAAKFVRLGDEMGFAADKYSRNVFHFFLAEGCVALPEIGQRDDAEWIEVVPDVPLEEVRDMVFSGKMNVPHSFLASMALDHVTRYGANGSR